MNSFPHHTYVKPLQLQSILPHAWTQSMVHMVCLWNGCASNLKRYGSYQDFMYVHRTKFVTCIWWPCLWYNILFITPTFFVYALLCYKWHMHLSRLFMLMCAHKNICKTGILQNIRYCGDKISAKWWLLKILTTCTTQTEDILTTGWLKWQILTQLTACKSSKCSH